MTGEEHDWATVPLLARANVGKYVWHSWNGNAPTPARIKAVSHGALIVRGGRFRVGPTGYAGTLPTNPHRYRGDTPWADEEIWANEPGFDPS